MANKHAAVPQCPPSSKKNPNIHKYKWKKKKLGVFLLHVLEKLRSSVQYVIICKINGLL